MPDILRSKLAEWKKARDQRTANMVRHLDHSIVEMQHLETEVRRIVQDSHDEFGELLGPTPAKLPPSPLPPSPQVAIVQPAAPPSVAPALAAPGVLTVMCGVCRAPVEHQAFVPGSDDLVEVKCHGAADRVSVKDRPNPWAFTDVKA